MIAPAPTFRSRLWRWTKSLARVTTIVVVTMIPIAAFGIPALARTSCARARMERILSRSMGTPVQLGAMEWSWKEGLLLQEISSAATADQTSFRIDRIQLRPRFSKMGEGKLRFRARVENPEVFVSDSGPSPRIPKLPKKGIRIDSIDVVNATVAVKQGSETIRVKDLTIRGSGRVEHRVLRLELSSLSGSCEELPFSGQGTLRVSQEGLSGQVGIHEAAAKESASLQNVLRALHLTPARPPALSEPF